MTRDLADYWARLVDTVHPEDVATFDRFVGHGFNLDNRPPGLPRIEATKGTAGVWPDHLSLRRSRTNTWPGLAVRGHGPGTAGRCVSLPATGRAP